MALSDRWLSGSLRRLEHKQFSNESLASPSFLSNPEKNQNKKKLHWPSQLELKTYILVIFEVVVSRVQPKDAHCNFATPETNVEGPIDALKTARKCFVTSSPDKNKINQELTMTGARIFSTVFRGNW